ncbi:hypothetical protein GCM10007940_41360 [Portibacter lacus]|uniref:IPTL-CTERM protein sorting domain-containing protein n=1 Tax=Portibacter lacus TaxID=1099794 RepID=A0AA37SXG5_9BACT|nr:hypothetical protein GCM10007940_41360 [Portibacter lacus]
MISEGIAQTDTGMTDGNIVVNPMRPSALMPPMQSFTFSGTITAASPTKSARLNRNAVASTCEVPKICDIFSTDAFPYNQHSFTNPSSESVCIEVILSTLCTEGNVGFDIYDGSFDPSNICTNYLADPGLSSGVPAVDVMLSYELAPSQTIVIVVFDVNQATCEIGGGYELAINGMFPAAVPTLGQWGLIILGILLAIFGVVAIKSRQFTFNKA